MLHPATRRPLNADPWWLDGAFGGMPGGLPMNSLFGSSYPGAMTYQDFLDGLQQAVQAGLIDLLQYTMMLQQLGGMGGMGGFGGMGGMGGLGGYSGMAWGGRGGRYGGTRRCGIRYPTSSIFGGRGGLGGMGLGGCLHCGGSWLGCPFC